MRVLGPAADSKTPGRGGADAAADASGDSVTRRGGGGKSSKG